MKQPMKPVMRVIRLDETSWKWLCDWLTELTKVITLEDMTPDTLRMGGILSDIKAAKREEDERGNAGKLQA